MSLVGSIFGQPATKPFDEDPDPADGSLSNLFAQSSTLPGRPQHKPLPPRKRKETSSEQEEPKRKRKAPKEKAEQAEQEEPPTAKTPDEEAKNDVNERTIFVGNLPLTTTRKSLASLFKSCGKVESSRLRSFAAAGVKLPSDRAGDQNLVKKVCANTHKLDTDAKSTAQGYVVFSSKDSVEEALKLNNTLMDGLRLRVDHATPTTDASRSIFVGNLPYQADESTLQQHFVKGCGFQEADVEGVRIIRDRDTMQCKGFGYVIFREKEMAAVALREMNESAYLKRQLRVTVCGKRFKGRRGEAKPEDPSKRRTFEGKRSAAVAQGAIKRILGKQTSAKEDAKPKKRRARGETKKGTAKSGPAKKAGVSKRAAAEAKIGKRMKKIQKRVSKGMGKARGK